MGGMRLPLLPPVVGALACVNENFKNQSLIDVQLIQEFSKSTKK